MSRFVLLDSSPLGEMSHPTDYHTIERWALELRAVGSVIAVPDIADYEVRRELLRSGMARSLRRLDWVGETFTRLSITTAVLLRAAEIWAKARNLGRPMAPPDRLDGDAILIAEALMLIDVGHEVIVATSNVGHLNLFVDAREWQDIA